jgi:glutamate carboxypeptidase
VSAVHPLLGYLEGHLDAIVDDLREFVDRETPTEDPELIASFASFLADYAGAVDGARVEVRAGEGGGTHLLISVGDGEGSPLLLLGHFDTVWPRGTAARRPFEVRDGIARGPGVYDMKAGLIEGFWALRALSAVRGTIPGPIHFLCTCDEEIGSPTSRALIEAEARQSRAVLVLEPSEAGALKTSRKGVGIFHLEVTGRASHAGLNPLGGISATDELCRLVLELHGQSSPERGTTFNAGVIRGGTRYNVIAAEAGADVDVRVSSLAEAERVTEFLRDLRPHADGAKIEVTGGLRWPPMERSTATVALFERARELAGELGFEIQETHSGGATDGNYCAAVGASVLDGLGAVGAGAHAEDEHVLISHFPQRTALVALLIEDLTARKE